MSQQSIYCPSGPRWKGKNFTPETSSCCEACLLPSSEQTRCHVEDHLTSVIVSRESNLLVVLLLFLLLLLIVVLLEALQASDSNSVQIPHAILADPSATLGVLLEDANALEALNSLALDVGRRGDVVLGTVALVLGASVVLGQRTDTDRLAQVDVASEGGYEVGEQ